MIKIKKQIKGTETVFDEPIKIDADISSHKDEIHIDNISIGSSFCKVNCTGGTNIVDYDATADLKGLQQFTAQFIDFSDYKLAGNISLRGKADFGAKNIKTTGTGSIQNFVMKSFAESSRSARPDKK